MLTALVPSQLEKYNSCQVWLEGFRSKKTKENYMSHLSLFLTFINIDPDSLISNNPSIIRDMTIRYIIHLKKKARQTAGKSIRGVVSVNSIPVYMTGIQSFLDFHEITLVWKKILKFLPETVPSDVRAYEKEEIRKMLSMADLRDRCILLIMCSGGLRVGALPDLKVKHQRILDEKSKIGMLVVYPNSRKDTYQTLLTPECMSSIHSYLQWRREQGERISDDSPLIRDKFDVFSVNRSNARPIRADSIYHIVARLVKKSGIKSAQLQPDHSFRHYFGTCLLNSDVNHELKELMMGHSLKLDESYYDLQSSQSQQKLLLEYLKAVDSLCIDPSFALRKQIKVYEKQLKDVPRVEQLQAQLANRIIEEESIKMQLEKLQREKESQAVAISTKYEKDMKIMKEEMALQNEKINRLLSVLVKEGKEGETVLGKETLEYLLKNPEKNRLFLSTVDCDHNDEITYDAQAKDILVVKKVLEEKASNKPITGLS